MTRATSAEPQPNDSPPWTVARTNNAIGCALVLPMHSLEPFMLMLSSVFVPLYGVILARLGGRDDVPSLVGASRVNPGAVAIWLLGVAVYHLCSNFAPQWGAALPSLVVTFLLARATRGSGPRGAGWAEAGRAQ